MHPDDSPGVMHTLKAHLDGRSDSYETEHRLRHKSGRWVWVLDKGRVIERDADGRALRVCGTHLDITGRKQAEEAIRLQADQYASILSTTTAGFWLLDESGRLLDVNENYCRMSGYTREELLALRISDLEAAETGTQTEQHMRKLIAEGLDRFETRHRTRDGRAYDVEVSTSHWKKGGRVIAFVRDITERKQAEDALRASQQLIEGIVQHDTRESILEGQGTCLPAAATRRSRRMRVLPIPRTSSAGTITSWGGATRRNCIAAMTAKSSQWAAPSFSSKSPRRPPRGKRSRFSPARPPCATRTVTSSA